MNALAPNFWGAHAAGMRVGAARADELFLKMGAVEILRDKKRNGFGEPPKPARGPRALPR
jgi:hypothetical protein